ncbi:MAG: hypothetical protein JKY92_02860 [Magnetovibrio sp.]|nr:hypothetical protein [Magnetovibrio sp.]
MGHSPLTSTPKTENYSGPGSIGGYDAKGSYQTGHNKNGSPTGGSKLDKHDREIGAYGQFTRDVVGRGDGSAAAGNTRVICTELVRRGLMDAKLQRLDAVFTIARLSNTTVRGYHVLAVPYVRLMKRSNLATHMIEPIARWRAEDVAYKMDARPRPNLKGRLVRIILEPICWLVGRVVEILPGDETRFHPFSQMKR